MQDWLVGIVGSDLAPLASILLSAVIVVGLAVLAIGLMRRAMRGGIGFRHTDGPRIEIVDVTSVDPKRKLVLVRRDQVEHLLLIGGGNDLVIEARIGRPASPPPRREAGFAEDPPAGFPRQSAPTARASAPQPVPQPGGPAMNVATAPRAPLPPEPRANLRSEPKGAAYEAPAIDIAPNAQRPQADPAGRPARVEPSFPFSDAPEPVERAKPAVQAGPASPLPERAAHERVPERAAPPAERPAPREAPEVQVERRSMATPTMAARAEAPRVEPRASAPREAAPPIEAPAPRAPDRARPEPQSGRIEPQAMRVEPPVSATPSAPGRQIPVVTPPAAPARQAPSVRLEGMEPAEGAGPRSDDRPPLTVRSFASAIGERQRPAPAPAAPPVATPAPSPASAPQSEPVTAATPESRKADDDDLAQLLSRELASDEPEPANADALFSASDTLETADFQSEEPKGEPKKDVPRELTIEEEMERLMRDFAAHTTDRR